MEALTPTAFQEKVKEACGPVLVDFWGEGCAPCQALLPKLEKMAGDFEGKVPFYKLNTTEHKRLALSERVMGLPTILIYKEGKAVEMLAGGQATEEAIRTKLEDLL